MSFSVVNSMCSGKWFVSAKAVWPIAKFAGVGSRFATALLVAGLVCGTVWGGNSLKGKSGGKKRVSATGSNEKVISKKQFVRLHELVKPRAGENAWNKVKWVRTLWEAHEKAVKEGKPIVVFTVGGEPLGIC